MQDRHPDAAATSSDARRSLVRGHRVEVAVENILHAVQRDRGRCPDYRTSALSSSPFGLQNLGRPSTGGAARDFATPPGSCPRRRSDDIFLVEKFVGNFRFPEDHRKHLPSLASSEKHRASGQMARAICGQRATR
jgi:hypothetical protein